MSDRRREIPSIDALLKDEQLKEYPHKLAKEALEQAVEKLREELARGISYEQSLTNVLMEEAINMMKGTRQNLKQVINATGIILNTNLGRAPLPEDAIDAIENISSGYSNLEIELATGKRGQRYSHISPILQKLTGSEDSLVVNNNAAAIFLILDTFARGKEVIVSRGELIEIGGSFRLPEVLKKSGCTLVEVGTTNRTYINDYEQAINENTALLLRAHTSNYKIVGFTHSPSLKEFTALGKKHNILTAEDMGSGLVTDLQGKGLPHEPTVRETLGSGIDLISFSGDKLIGGPQAGIILGRTKLISEIKKNPFLRTVRIGKHILGLLETVLRIHVYEDATLKLPHLSMLTQPLSSVKARATSLCKQLSTVLDKKFAISIDETAAEVGGGSYPGVEIPAFAVTITSRALTPDHIQTSLRNCDPPIIARVADDKVLLVMTTVFDNDLPQIVESMRHAFATS
jgi:L-seryl-tRNA(Ser) seleniumtransferase